MPKVTAIITVYNEETWIASAVNSLLNQTLGDIEVLVLNDGSTDGTAERLASFSDGRLKVVHGARMGRARALRLAVELASGDYVANLDADDEAYVDRLEKQSAFLDANSEYAWVGGGEDREDSQRGEHYVRYYPQDDQAIRNMAVKCIPYCHSAVMFRRSLAAEGLNYCQTQPFLIDFEYFLRVANKYKVANLDVPVVKRRAHEKSYFQRSFTYGQQNRELSRLCRIARRQFRLPIWMEVYPLARSIYPRVPKVVKKMARRVLGLKEIG